VAGVLLVLPSFLLANAAALESYFADYRILGATIYRIDPSILMIDTAMNIHCSFF
jgi:hypothetical protein